MTTECYRLALQLSPDHPAALLGAAEAHLASAQVHLRMGAMGMASADLRQAAGLASACAARHGNLLAAWKVLGDVQLQHAAVTPHAQLRELASAAPGAAAATAAVAAVGARAAAVRAARVAYCRAIHLEPSRGLVWGDAAAATLQEAALLAQAGIAQPEAPASSRPAAASLRSLAWRLAQGGLRLEPASDCLWPTAGAVAGGEEEGGAAAAAAREFCWSRALQLNPKRAGTWAALGRMYAENGAGA